MSIRRMVVHYGFSPWTHAAGRHLAGAALDTGVGYPHPCAHRQHVPTELFEECDAYLWVESGPSSYPLHIEQAPVPTAGYLIDVHLHPSFSALQAALFDIVFIAQRDYVSAIRNVNPNTFWLPLAAPQSFLALPRGDRFVVGFVGSLSQSSTRRTIMNAVSASFLTNDFTRHYSISEMGELYSSSRVVVNPAVGGDVNMRFFEAMACGAALVSPALTNGLEELATDGREYVTADFTKVEHVIDVIADLSRSGRYREIGSAAREVVGKRHTYPHRIHSIVERLQGAHANAPIRSMSRSEVANHYLALASALGDVRLLRHVARGADLSGTGIAAAGRTVASAAHRAARARLGLQ